MSTPVDTVPRAQGGRILSMVTRHVGGVAVFWENLKAQSASVDLVYLTTDTRTYFDDETRTLHYNVHDPLAQVYATLARAVKLDDYAVLVANERFELEFFLWSRTRRPVACIVHTNHEHSYGLALRHASAVDHFFCVSDTAESYLRGRGVAHVSSFNYSTFIDVDPAITKANRIVYVGRLTPDKNILETLDLFRLFKTRGYEVRMIGVGELEPEVRAALEPHEVLIGVPRATVLREMASARFLCLNSYIEGLPIVYFEAMHFHLGVICNYLDKSAARVLGDNHLLNTTPDALLARMESFSFTPAPEPRRVNNPVLNEAFLQSLLRVPAPAAPRPVFRPRGTLDNLPWIPASFIRAFRAWKMQRLHRA